MLKLPDTNNIAMPVSFLLVARLFPQELASLDKETVEPVMMNPVSRPFERHRAGIGEIVHAAIVEMADRPAFLPIDMEDGEGYPRPEVPHFLQRHLDRRDRAHINVELPAISAVLVLRDAVQRQLPRPVRRKMPVFFLHPGQGLV